jgi:methionine-gamma-lyase
LTDENRRPNRRPGLATRAIHHGYDPADHEGALTPPVYLTSTYAFESAEDGGALFRGEKAGYIYGRTRNPTQTLLEERMADLEGAEAGLALASGMAAITATMWTLLEAGDRVVIDRILYGNSFAFFVRGLAKFGVEVAVVDLGDPAALRDALATPTKLVYFETPANPDLRVLDITAISHAARAAGALTVVDNTFATPVIQRPIALGADLVLHSATKYLGGHGDLLGGILVGPAATVQQVRGHGLRYLTGATLSPHAAFLVLRGLKTLELRMERHARNAEALAKLLAAHPAVARVHYPTLDGAPHRDLARRQMATGGGLVSFELKDGMQGALTLMNALRLMTRAVSLGDAETLIQHPASMTHSTYTQEERARYGISDGLVRVSAGLETLEDIEDDLAQALDAVAG